ncbi:MAG TPA: arylsulfatase [Bryobacteraceae bacterium]|nr:arylsulfatase [Bryobacteraceae bacterium]
MEPPGRLTRRSFLAAPSLLAAPPARRPNILLIITDDQGYGDLGCHGNPHLKTPNIDRIAAEGVEFTQFHVTPVCAPTRAGLLTGRYNYRTGVVDTYLGRAMMHPDELTVAEMLREAGYRTGIFGKWHLGDNYPLRAIDQGFEEALVHTGGGIGQPSDPPGNRYFDPILFHNGKPEKHTGYCTDVFANAAIRFIEQNRSRPFFAYLATNAPHVPLEIAETWVTPYRRMGLDAITAAVYGMVQNVDENVGRILEALRSTGVERDTIVLFMTDNGPQQARYNADMRGLKGSVYEGGIRVPLFVRWPGRFDGGRRVDGVCANIDLAPTLLELCGIRPRAKLDGVSLASLTWPERSLFFQWHRGDVPQPHRGAAVRSGRWKLVHGTELYDLGVDPAETKDVAATHPEVVTKLVTEYEHWFRDVSATRGYVPPRIVIGSKHENPTLLTRQDWRGPRAGWDKNSIGHWEVEVQREARYRVTLRFEGAGEARFRLGAVEVAAKPAPGATEHTWNNVRLPAGPATLEASIGNTGVRYVEVERL